MDAHAHIWDSRVCSIERLEAVIEHACARLQSMRNVDEDEMVGLLEAYEEAYAYNCRMRDQYQAIRRRRFALVTHSTANDIRYRAQFLQHTQRLILPLSLPNIGTDAAWLISLYAYEPAVFV